MKRQVATFYIGHNVKGSPQWSHSKDVLPALRAAFPDGFTAWEATGGYAGGLEKTTVVQVVGFGAFQAHAAKHLLEFAFSQDEVLATVSEVETV